MSSSSEYYKKALKAAQKNYEDSIMMLQSQKKSLSDNLKNGVSGIYKNYLQSSKELLGGEGLRDTSDIQLKSALGEQSAALKTAADKADSDIEIKKSYAKADMEDGTASVVKSRDEQSLKDAETAKTIDDLDKSSRSSRALSLIKNGVVSDSILADAGISNVGEVSVSKDDTDFGKNLVELITETGYSPTDSELERADMTRDQASALRSVYEKELEKTKKQSAGSSSGSKTTKLTYGAMKRMVEESDDPVATYWSLQPQLSFDMDRKLSLLAYDREEEIYSKIMYRKPTPLKSSAEMNVYDEAALDGTVDGVVKACLKLKGDDAAIANILRNLAKDFVLRGGAAYAAANRLGVKIMID